MNHPNKFIRESGFFFGATIFRLSDLKTIKTLGLGKNIAKGLADNCSQVRYAASVAVRAFFDVGNADEEIRKVYYPEFLPMMCFNRYYVAEGLRLYSQETWKNVVGEKGKDYVLTYFDLFITFYLEQGGSDNYAARETACLCISELCSKIAVLNKEIMKPYVSRMLECLIGCFKDPVWAVKETACVACGRFVLVFLVCTHR